MSLYRCYKCGCVENTALGSYWGMSDKLCSECLTGVWHGKFKKRSAKGMFIDEQGFIYDKDDTSFAYGKTQVID